MQLAPEDIRDRFAALVRLQDELDRLHRENARLADENERLRIAIALWEEGAARLRAEGQRLVTQARTLRALTPQCMAVDAPTGKRCDQESGHPGPHEVRVGGGITIAWGVR